MSLKLRPWILVLLPACLDFGEVREDVGASPADAAVADLGFQDAAVVGDAMSPDAQPACVEGPAPGEMGVEIHIDSSSVDRTVVTIPVGTVVVWTNLDDMRHRMRSGEPGATIAVADGGFDTRDLSRGDGYAHRFCTPRSMLYYCSSHPSRMRGYQLVIQ